MFLAEPPATPPVEALHQASAADMGFTMNLVRLWAWRPELYKAFVALRLDLMKDSALDRRDLAAIVCATAAQRRDGYCALAYGLQMSQMAGPEAAAALASGGDDAALTQRDRALARWSAQVARDPNATTAADVQALRDAGLDERAIFDATLLAALRLAFTSVNAALGVQPDAQLRARAPAELAAAVNYGRPTAMA